MEATAGDAAAAAGVSGSELVSRIVVSIVACGIVTWQLAETANFRVDATWLATEGSRRCRLGGTALQYYLVLLMMLSLLSGLAQIVSDTIIYSHQDEHGRVPDAHGHKHTVAANILLEEIGVHLVLGKLSQLILSLLIIGLGVSGLRQGATYAQAATALGVLSLFVRRLPPPLVLVFGVWCVQRTPTRDQHADDGNSCLPGGCCTLRCALRPLLWLAVLEAIYASTTVDEDLRRRLEQTKHDAHLMVENTARMHRGEPELTEQLANMESALEVYDSIRPEVMIEMAQQQLGEVVQLGTVLALGLSGRAHGLKNTLWPVAAAFVPGLPVSFALVFYFLLETRQTQGGGTLLPS